MEQFSKNLLDLFQTSVNKISGDGIKARIEKYEKYAHAMSVYDPTASSKSEFGVPFEFQGNTILILASEKKSGNVF